MNKEILRRYFNGQSSDWEKKQVQEYFKGDDMQMFDEYISDQEEKKQGDTSKPDPVYEETFYAELMKRIAEKEVAPLDQKRHRPLFFKIAASILLFTGIASALYIINGRHQEIARQPEMETLSNNGISLRRVQLFDGTTIWMNPGALLKYDKKHFGDTTREVFLSGEAYFDIAPNVLKPFKVHAGGLTTRVLGTSFNVEAYQKEGKVRILLISGRVRVSSANRQNALNPGQMLEYNSSNKNISISSVDISGLREQFTSGKLVFEDVPLRDVFNRLEDIFRINITLTDSSFLEGKTISGSWFRNNPEETLQRILFIHGLKLKKKGEKSYVITD